MQENRKSERKIKMEKKDRKKYAVLTVISICLCLIGGLLANLAQTDMGNVTKKTILFESASGHTISADLLIPPRSSSYSQALPQKLEPQLFGSLPSAFGSFQI